MSASFKRELWPANARPEAYRGATAHLQHVLAAHSEAHPMALHMQFLTAFGNAVGLGAWATAAGSRHYPRLFTVLVGRSAKGRKGSAWAQLQPVLTAMDPAWVEGNFLSGLSTGEGLIHRLAGSSEPDQRMIALDDGRLLVIETELASLLNSLARRENRLSSVWSAPGFSDT